MPRGDRTGPMGMGQMTGRGAGYCAGYPVPGFANFVPGSGRGFARGSGRGRRFVRGMGWRLGYAPVPVQSVQPAQPQQAYPQYTREQEIADLRAEKELIERDLKAIAERIKELENKK